MFAIYWKSGVIEITLTAGPQYELTNKIVVGDVRRNIDWHSIFITAIRLSTVIE